MSAQEYHPLATDFDPTFTVNDEGDVLPPNNAIFEGKTYRMDHDLDWINSLEDDAIPQDEKGIVVESDAVGPHTDLRLHYQFIGHALRELSQASMRYGLQEAMQNATYRRDITNRYGRDTMTVVDGAFNNIGRHTSYGEAFFRLAYGANANGIAEADVAKDWRIFQNKYSGSGNSQKRTNSLRGINFILRTVEGKSTRRPKNDYTI